MQAAPPPDFMVFTGNANPRMAAEIAEQHASVEGIAQRIRDAILKEAGE